MTKKTVSTPPKPTVSRLTVWLSAIAATLVMVLLCMAYVWLDTQGYSSDTTYTSTQGGDELSTAEAVVVLVIVGGIILAPGILVALIVLPILRKQKRK